MSTRLGYNVGLMNFLSSECASKSVAKGTVYRYRLAILSCPVLVVSLDFAIQDIKPKSSII